MIGGIRIMGDPSLVETVEDWSEVRSPARARRRRRQGHRQRIRYVTRPQEGGHLFDDTLYVHPEMISMFVERMREAFDSAD